MNTTMKFHPVTLLITAIIFFSSCNNEKKKDETSNTANPAATEQNTTTPAAPAGPAEKAVVSFKVNDSTANTQKGGGNDSEPQLGMFTEVTKHLSLDLLGDVTNRPHRGWLHFAVTNFKFEPGTYTLSPDANLSFTRYETANAGGSSDYIADSNPVNKGTEFTISFTSIEKDPAGNGSAYLVSGTFSAKLYNKVYSMKRDSKEEVVISEGKFENVPVVGGPRN